MAVGAWFQRGGKKKKRERESSSQCEEVKRDMIGGCGFFLPNIGKKKIKRIDFFFYNRDVWAADAHIE